jgi:uncharacterized protein
VISSDGKTFTKFIELPERGKVLVRSDDGVHFTANGQRLLAKLALSQLVLKQLEKVQQPKPQATPKQNPAVSNTKTVASSSSAHSSAPAKIETNNQPLVQGNNQ